MGVCWCPRPFPRHQVVAGRLVGHLRDAAPAGLDAVEAVGLRLSAERLLIPDGVVARSEVLVADVATLVPADVALKESSYVEETVVGSGVLRVERPYPVEVAVERLLVPR